MKQRDMKDHIYEAIAQIGKATSSPKRLELLDLLCQSEKPVETLAAQAGIDVKLASAHLKVLRTTRLVETRKDGKHVFYRIADAEVAVFWVKLRKLAEMRSLEIQKVTEQYFQDRDSMVSMDYKTLLKKARSGDVVILDVRPDDEYAAGHIPYSRSVPLTQLKRKLSEIPKSKEVIAYCRGPYCVLSHEAIEILRRKGYRVSRLSSGVSEWAAAGLPLERKGA